MEKISLQTNKLFFNSSIPSTQKLLNMSHKSKLPHEYYQIKWMHLQPLGFLVMNCVNVLEIASKTAR